MNKVKEISVNVSKKLGQPHFGSAMVSASITVSVDDDAEVKSAFKDSWLMAWEEVDKQVNEIKSTMELEELSESVEEVTQEVQPVPAQPAPQVPSGDPIMDATAPFCPIHKVYKNWKPAGVSKSGKAYPAFYACPGRNPDGSFCKSK